MTILQWIILGAFAGGVCAAVLSVVFRWDAHAVAVPNLYWLAVAAILLAVGVTAGVVWIGIKIFGGH